MHLESWHSIMLRVTSRTLAGDRLSSALFSVMRHSPLGGASFVGRPVRGSRRTSLVEREPGEDPLGSGRIP